MWARPKIIIGARELVMLINRVVLNAGAPQ